MWCQHNQYTTLSSPLLLYFNFFLLLLSVICDYKQRVAGNRFALEWLAWSRHFLISLSFDVSFFSEYDNVVQVQCSRYIGNHPPTASLSKGILVQCSSVFISLKEVTPKWGFMFGDAWEHVSQRTGYVMRKCHIPKKIQREWNKR